MTFDLRHSCIYDKREMKYKCTDEIYTDWRFNRS